MVANLTHYGGKTFSQMHQNLEGQPTATKKGAQSQRKNTLLHWWRWSARIQMRGWMTVSTRPLVNYCCLFVKVSGAFACCP